MYNVILFKLKMGKNVRKGERNLQKLDFSFSSERECGFSLDFRAIRPSEFFSTRRKVALRCEAYAWAPVLRSFDKLREVGVLSYLSFTLFLSVL